MESEGAEEPAMVKVDAHMQHQNMHRYKERPLITVSEHDKGKKRKKTKLFKTVNAMMGIGSLLKRQGSSHSTGSYKGSQAANPNKRESPKSKVSRPIMTLAKTIFAYINRQDTLIAASL